MRALACALLLAVLCSCSDEGRSRQPFFARVVCVVEEWIGREDYRRRDPATEICDEDGIRVPQLTPVPPEDPEPEGHEERDS